MKRFTGRKKKNSQRRKIKEERRRRMGRGGEGGRGESGGSAERGGGKYDELKEGIGGDEENEEGRWRRRGRPGRGELERLEN